MFQPNAFAAGCRLPVIVGFVLSSLTVTLPVPVLPRRSVAVAVFVVPAVSAVLCRSPGSGRSRRRSRVGRRPGDRDVAVVPAAGVRGRRDARVDVRALIVENVRCVHRVVFARALVLALVEVLVRLRGDGLKAVAGSGRQAEGPVRLRCRRTLDRGVRSGEFDALRIVARSDREREMPTLLRVDRAADEKVFAPPLREALSTRRRTRLRRACRDECRADDRGAEKTRARSAPHLSWCSQCPLLKLQASRRGTAFGRLQRPSARELPASPPFGGSVRLSPAIGARPRYRSSSALA